MFLHSYIPNAVLLDFGFYQIRWYGLCLTLAVAGGFFVVWKLLKTSLNPLLIKEGGSKSSPPLQGGGLEGVINLLFWIAIGGIVGGRLVHVLTFFDYYWHQPWQILAIWNGGIAFYGVFIGGLIAVILQNGCHSEESRARDDEESRENATRSLTPIAIGVRDDKKKAILSLLDVLVVGLVFGQFIGRWGNWFNQELFGRPTNLPWGIPIDVWHRPVGLENFQYFHPVFLYESLFSLVLFLGLWQIYKKAKSSGIVLAFFIIFHSVARFFLEFLRLDAQPEFLGLRLFQWVAILEFVLGWIVYFGVKVWYNKSNKKLL